MREVLRFVKTSFLRCYLFQPIIVQKYKIKIKIDNFFIIYYFYKVLKMSNLLDTFNNPHVIIDTDPAGQTHINAIYQRIKNRQIYNEDQLESQLLNDVPNIDITRLINYFPRPNYYLIIAIICAIFLHNNTFYS